MSTLVIAEKPSMARQIAAVLGATEKNNGYVSGNSYIVSWCFGHLAGLAEPETYTEKWSGKWSFEQLPMIPDNWIFRVSDSGKEQFSILKKLMTDSSVTEIVCATDADCEGECIFRYVYNLVKPDKPVKRLWISSLEESSIKDGFALNTAPDISRCINNDKVTGHHAIIPTLKIENADIDSLAEGQKNILLLITFRLLCASSAPHKYISRKITIESENNIFTASGKTVTEQGWKVTEKQAFAVLKCSDEDKNGDVAELPECEPFSYTGNDGNKHSGFQWKTK